MCVFVFVLAFCVRAWVYVYACVSICMRAYDHVYVPVLIPKIVVILFTQMTTRYPCPEPLSRSTLPPIQSRVITTVFQSDEHMLDG